MEQHCGSFRVMFLSIWSIEVQYFLVSNKLMREIYGSSAAKYVHQEVAYFVCLLFAQQGVHSGFLKLFH